MSRKRLSGLRKELEVLSKRIADIEVLSDGDSQVENEAKAIENQPADKAISDEAEDIAKDEADATEESIENLSGENVEENMDYDDQNTKMSSNKVAAKLLKLAKSLLKDK